MRSSGRARDCYNQTRTSHRHGGVRLLIFQQHELTLRKIASEFEEARWVDTLLEDAWWTATRGDRRIQSLLHGLFISR
jgi:hypothetical protein